MAPVALERAVPSGRARKELPPIRLSSPFSPQSSRGGCSSWSPPCGLPLLIFCHEVFVAPYFPLAAAPCASSGRHCLQARPFPVPPGRARRLGRSVGTAVRELCPSGLGAGEGMREPCPLCSHVLLSPSREASAGQSPAGCWGVKSWWRTSSWYWFLAVWAKKGPFLNKAFPACYAYPHCLPLHNPFPGTEGWWLGCMSKPEMPKVHLSFTKA